MKDISDISQIKSCFFIGIAGSGMSAIASWLNSKGIKVKGSDRSFDKNENLELILFYKRNGIEIYPQNGCGISDESVVIHSSAIESDNPDLIEAKRKSLPIIHRAELLKIISSGIETSIAVTGTAGKSSVTAMLGWILSHAGLKPDVINGAILPAWKTENSAGNMLPGNNSLIVYEADESDRSLLIYNPKIAVITNAFVDHFSYKETVDLFNQFSLKAEKTIGFMNWSWENHVSEIKIEGFKIKFNFDDMHITIPIAGKHNIINSAFAIKTAIEIGIDKKIIVNALSTFPGLSRRFEKIGEINGITVVDDFAHNPEKIRNSLQTARAISKRVIAVWQPHGFKPLKQQAIQLADVFCSELRSNDLLILLPVYYAGGTADKSYNTEKFITEHKLESRNIIPLKKEKCKEFVINETRKGDIILIMGARDPLLHLFAIDIYKDLASKYHHNFNQ